MAQEPTPHPATDDHAEAVAAQVAAEITHLQAEVAELRRGRTDPARVRELEHRIAAQASSMATLSAQNERVAARHDSPRAAATRGREQGAEGGVRRHGHDPRRRAGQLDGHPLGPE